MWRTIRQTFSSVKQRVARWAQRALSTGGLDPHAGTGFWLGGRSGVNVDENTALTYSACWAAVNRISSTIASLPCLTYQSDSKSVGGSRQKADRHPVAPLLRWAPNPEMSSMSFFETVIAHMLTWGNGYAEIELTGAGQPYALWPIAPNRVKVERDKVSRQLIYKVRRGENSSSREDVLQPFQMLHLAGLGFDGVVGYSVIRMARESMGLGMAAEQFGQAFFGNGASAAGMLSHPSQLGDDARTRLRQDWERLHRGPGNAGRVAVLEEGMTYTPLSIPPDDAQFLQTRQFQVSEVARWYGIPAHLIGDLTRSTNNNIEQQGEEFLMYCLRPWLVRIELELRRKLLSPADLADGYFQEFDTRELLRGATADRFTAWGKAITDGWMSVNEVRHEENLAPVVGGELYRFPLNVTTLDKQAAAAPEPKPPPRAPGP